jgi:transcriptional regulator with XRE-family HTH domain
MASRGVTMSDTHLDSTPMADTPDTFAEVFTRELGARRWSKSRAARHFGVNQSTVSRWCKGGLYPGEHLIPQVAEFLGLDADTVRSLKYEIEAPLSFAKLEAVQEVQAERIAEMERLVTQMGNQIGHLEAEQRITHAIVDRIAGALDRGDDDDPGSSEESLLLAEFASDVPSADGNG